MIYCYGNGCPLRFDCYRHTQPTRGRDEFVRVPYDPAIATCEYFVSNLPSEEFIRMTAYYLWQRKGCPENQAEANWEEAFLSLCENTGRIP